MSHSPDHSAASFCCSEDAVDAVSSDPQPYSLSSPPDEASIDRYFDSEPLHMPNSHYLRSIDLTARQDSISWILKVSVYMHIYIHIYVHMLLCISRFVLILINIGAFTLPVQTTDGVPLRQLLRSIPLVSFPSGTVHIHTVRNICIFPESEAVVI